MTLNQIDETWLRCQLRIVTRSAILADSRTGQMPGKLHFDPPCAYCYAEGII